MQKMLLISFHKPFEKTWEYDRIADCASDLILQSDYVDSDEEIIQIVSNLKINNPQCDEWSFFIFNEIEEFAEFEFIEDIGIHFVHPYLSVNQAAKIDKNSLEHFKEKAQQEFQERILNICDEVEKIVSEYKENQAKKLAEQHLIARQIEELDRLQKRFRQYESLRKEFENANTFS